MPGPDAIWINGYFFNHRYWHHEREYVLRLFEMHPAVIDYVQTVCQV